MKVVGIALVFVGAVGVQLVSRQQSAKVTPTSSAKKMVKEAQIRITEV